ncbi:coiled-coil domain-containing protein 9-like isoform X2 [Acipenser ruthenus]|uniref:coiled-coil domain-containing protein 9-like isoform X2 n=1 Tax=Acipenser ruthenus TaxID=7906 RepID=UPI002740EC46|nr:coiled-coil domain-containing protein 9-like isoform X2 [Acipenser ruthenus]
MPTAQDLKTKEEKDAELDKRIEALRKKNEALVRRYQEIEEDKKRAEQEGIAVTTARKPRPSDSESSDHRRTEKENFSITVDLTKPAGEKRVISNDKKPTSGRGGEGGSPPGRSPPRRGGGSGRLGRGGRGGPRYDWGGGGEQRHDRGELHPDRGELHQHPDSQPAGGAVRTDRVPRGRRGRGAGGGAGNPGNPAPDRRAKEWEEKRRLNIEKMNEEMEKIAEYERGNRSDGQGEKNPGRNFLDDYRRSGPVPDADRKEGSRRHVRNWGGVDFERVKTGGPEWDKEWQGRRAGGPKGPVDMTMSMTGRERSEYERWKQEREQIDQDRLARHRNATGQWRREWDAQKTESMFKEAGAAMQEQGETDSRRGRGRYGSTWCSFLPSEENKRPPKQPTFGDFLGQGKGREAGRGRGRGKDRNYSMHDNRWEEEVKGGEAEGKKEAGSPRNKDEAQKKNDEEEGVPSQEADEDQWEDASDGEEEEGESEEEKEEEKEKKLPQKQNKKQQSPPPTSNPPRPSRGGKQPKLQLSPKQTTPEPPSHEPSKPLSPFSPAEGYDPVMDWGEEMEQQSPRSSLGEPPLGQPAPANPKPTSPKSGPSCAKVVLGEEPEVGAETQSEADPGERERDRETQSPARAEGSSEEKPNSPADPPAEPEPAAQSQVEAENVSGGLETGGVSTSMPEREEEGSAVSSKLDSQGTSDETGERENEPGCSETAAASKSKEPTETEPSIQGAPAVPDPPMDTPASSEVDPPSQVSNPQPDRDLEPATESQTATG